MATGYNLFDKPVEDIEAKDLRVLRDVSEGWYIEYKSASKKPSDIGKSLTSFANQYGGYLFFGIEESRDSSHTAKSFPGIPNSQLDTLLSHIRDGASQHSQPDVRFVQKVIPGPVPEIGLGKDCSIVIVDIPQGTQTPYVHSSGRVFRRIGNSSAPKVEADRYLLDELWKRREHNRKLLRKFVEQRNPVLRDQGIGGWFHLYVFPDLSQRSSPDLLTVDKVADVFLKDRIGRTAMSVPMDAVYSSGMGVCARQAGSPNREILGLTVDIRIGGAASFCVPINVTSARDLAPRGYESVDEFHSMLEQSGLEKMLVADFSHLAVSVTALLNQLLLLKDSINDSRDLMAGFSIHGTRGSIPYLDSSAYVSRLKKYGFPTSHLDEIEYPGPQAEVDEMFRLKYLEAGSTANSPEKEQLRSVEFSLPILKFALAYAGVTTGLTDLDIGDLRFDQYPGKSAGQS